MQASERRISEQLAGESEAGYPGQTVVQGKQKQHHHSTTYHGRFWRLEVASMVFTPDFNLSGSCMILFHVPGSEVPITWGLAP